MLDATAYIYFRLRSTYSSKGTDSDKQYKPGIVFDNDLHIFLSSQNPSDTRYIWLDRLIRST